VTQWENNACRGPLINGRVEVPMRALEEAIVNALDTIGYRTEYRGLYNDARAFVVGDNSSAGPSSSGDGSSRSAAG